MAFSKYKFRSPEYRGRRTLTSPELDKQDTIVSALESVALGQLTSQAFVHFDGRRLCVISSYVGDIHPRNPANKQPIKYCRHVIVKVSPPTDIQDLPNEIKNALDSRNYVS